MVDVKDKEFKSSKMVANLLGTGKMTMSTVRAASFIPTVKLMKASGSKARPTELARMSIKMEPNILDTG